MAEKEKGKKKAQAAFSDLGFLSIGGNSNANLSHRLKTRLNQRC